MTLFAPKYQQALKIPYVERDMRIGLFGGSFNPPHAGHLNVSELAIQRLELDQCWWIVTPGNPLKDHSELAPLEKRIKLCEAMTPNPKIKITAFEASHQMRYTADTIEFVIKRNPTAKFVWIMGADNLKNFHKWERWQEILGMIPIAIIDRPGSTLSYRSARAALSTMRFRYDETDASLLPSAKPPAWTFIHGPRSSLSSTAIRNALKKN